MQRLPMLSLPDFRQKQIIICFAAEGQKISFRNDNLLIKDKEDEIVMQATCYKIFSVWIVGHTTITSGILERSRKFGFSIYLLSYSHKLYGIWCAATEGNFLLRKKQYEYSGLSIAKKLVANKIANQRALLNTLRKKSLTLKEAIANLDVYVQQLDAAPELTSVLGHEGVASRLFFSHWYGDMNWQSRRPRTKIDPINTTLDIGYTYLFNFIESMTHLYGFDVYQGVYHRCFYQRKSLVCDLVEPFRCIVDKQVRKAWGLGQLKLEDFKQDRGQYLLKIEKNKDYTRWLMQGILEHKESIFSYVQEYYRCFMRSKPIEEYPVFQVHAEK